jgi:zinc protease
MIKQALLFAGLLLWSSSAQALTNIQEIKTPSGYTIWLAEDHTLPIVTVKFSFEQSGAAYDPAGKEGLASFLSQMLDEGAGDMDSLAFHQALENNAIRYAADTGQDIITVSMQTLSEHKEEALNLLLLSLTKPRFDTEATTRIRASIISDLVQLEEEPNYIASRQWKELAFAGHPYSRLRRGTPESLKSVTHEDLRHFAQTHFFAGKAPVISVVGDITADDIRDWPLPALTPRANTPTLPDVQIPDGNAPHVVMHAVPQTVVIASLPALKRDDPQFYALQLLNQILGGNSITSRLGSEMRNKRGLTYHVGTDIEVMDHAAFISANFATRNAQANEALSVFNTVLKDISENGISEQELKEAKNYLIGSFPLEHDTQNEMAGLMIGIQHFRLGIDYPQKRNALIERVTLPDVNALAKKFLSHTPLVVMAGNPQAKP